jgi:chromosome segregation ATPase
MRLQEVSEEHRSVLSEVEERAQQLSEELADARELGIAREKALQVARAGVTVATSAFSLKDAQAQETIDALSVELSARSGELAENAEEFVRRDQQLRDTELRVEALEEVRVQATAEMDQARSQAQAELEQVRSQAQAELDRVRSVSESELEQVRSQAESEADQARSQAEAELQQVRSQVETDRDQRLGALSSEHQVEVTRLEQAAAELAQAQAVQMGVMEGEREEHLTALEELQQAAAEIDKLVGKVEDRDGKIEKLHYEYSSAATTYANKLANLAEVADDRQDEIERQAQDLLGVRDELEQSGAQLADVQADLAHLRKQAETQIQDLIMARLTVEDDLAAAQANIDDPDGELMRMQSLLMARDDEIRGLQSRNRALVKRSGQQPSSESATDPAVGESDAVGEDTIVEPGSLDTVGEETIVDSDVVGQETIFDELVATRSLSAGGPVFDDTASVFDLGDDTLPLHEELVELDLVPEGAGDSSIELEQSDPAGAAAELGETLEIPTMADSIIDLSRKS